MSTIVALTNDPIMKELAATYGSARIGRTPIFVSLVRAVISQQLSDAAASNIFQRLKNASPIEPYELLALDLEAYRSCGISKAKACYIKSISEAMLEGRLENIDHLPDEDVIKILTRLKGVGRWTAEMILVFALGREDVWPLDDAGLLRAARILYGVQSLEDFITLGLRFKPYRSHAAWYLWCYLDSK